MSCRITRSKDLRTIQSLDEKLIGDVLSASELGGSVWWLARVNGVVAGYCGVYENGMPGACYMIRAGVLEDFRGCGIQRRMINARVAWARKRAYSTVVTDTQYQNTPSIVNLIKCGFLPYTPNNPWSEDAIYWRRCLNGS